MMDFITELLDLKKKVRTLEQNTSFIKPGVTFGTNYLIIPVLTADPSSPSVGQIWYNSTSGTFKCYDGAVKTFTIT